MNENYVEQTKNLLNMKLSEEGLIKLIIEARMQRDLSIKECREYKNKYIQTDHYFSEMKKRIRRFNRELNYKEKYLGICKKVEIKKN